MSATPPAPHELPGLQRHTPLEDAQALLVGTLFIAVGVVLFKHAGLLAGGMAGLAFLLHYGTDLPFGAAFFALNLPFYWLGWKRMGRAFTVKTFSAVALLSVFSEVVPHWLRLEGVHPAFAAVLGGLLVGTGMLMLFRHRASVGGIGILAVVLQERRGWRAGRVQMAVDVVILAAAFLVAEPDRVVLSVLGALAMNLLLAINFRPGRYMAV